MGKKDMEIYADMAARYGDRIKGVLIRKLPYIKNEKRTKRYRQRIESFNIPFITFH
jgi:phosphatidate phosphatase APP1